ncbi:putative U6 snRNA-associated Sm-like protein LSm7 [Hypsibius exemplaris]|uniref:U6 snRNA-associated Sm-like protein LSm7 n=1 Tax=Hypsibius exemplaris TaxID=2072580 RepID=A0A9X6NAQ3_HYPEX|nr:putative U6 snRNA-associated Sm-like protein LSm7 [Hypsibius exemplaris]
MSSGQGQTQSSGHGGGQRGADNRGGDNQDRKKTKETLFDLGRYLDKVIHVKFVGGREASGVLKGYDALLNLVLDDTSEQGRGDSDEPVKAAEEKRALGLVVCRGPSIVMLCPEGMEPINNPFVAAE